MGYSIREGFAVINDETLEVEEFHDTPEEALHHVNQLGIAAADPTGEVAAEVVERRKRRKKVAPRMGMPKVRVPASKGNAYSEPKFVPEGQANLHNPTFVPEPCD